MSGNICDVCSGEAMGVTSSSLGAFSNAYCKDCAESDIEPYNDLVGFGFCVSTKLDDIDPSYHNMVHESLAFHGKSMEEWKSDVEKLERDFVDGIAQEMGFEDFDDLIENDEEVEFYK